MVIRLEMPFAAQVVKKPPKDLQLQAAGYFFTQSLYIPCLFLQHPDIRLAIIINKRKGDFMDMVFIVIIIIFFFITWLMTRAFERL